MVKKVKAQETSSKIHKYKNHTYTNDLSSMVKRKSKYK